MIDALDKQTQALPLEPVKRGRGRPKTGNAMTPAEKQRAYRERQKEAAGNVTENTDTHKTGSIELLRERALSRGRACVAQARLIGELEKRIAELETQLESREAVTENENSALRWHHEYKIKGDRKWIRARAESATTYAIYDTAEMKEHISDLNKNNKTARWRAVRDDGMIYDPKAPK